MSKAITGLAELGGAVAMGALAFEDPALLSSPIFDKIWAGLVLSGVSSEIGALADAITANRGMNITTRQPAGNRAIIYGEQRIGGNLIYNTTTGSKHDQNNHVIMLAGHTIDGIVNMYLDGRQVYWENESAGYTTCPGGYQFGGAANGTKYYDSGGYAYNFGTLVFCTAYYGYQTAAGGADPSLHANDPNWAASANGVPYGGGCAWVYFKFEYDTTEFGNLPEVKFTIRGRNQIWDPRTNTTGFTANWALCVADFLMDEEFGFGCSQSEINIPQLITAANLCDELVTLANGSQEPRYTFNARWDTSTPPGDALRTMLGAAGGNLVWSAGQYWIFPASAFSSTATFTQSDLLADIEWHPYRSIDALFNEVRGTYTAPNFPYAPVGDLYNKNGKDPDGYQQNNFNYAWQPTSFPYYAQDALHGYATNQFLTQDGGYQLVSQLDLPGTLSVATAQRLAKIKLMLNRSQGTGTLTMGLQAMCLMPMDVFGFTYEPYGWVNKPLQVTSFQIMQDMDTGVPRTYCIVGVREFDPNNYAWSASEELTILDTPNAALQYETQPQPPTEITCLSGSQTEITNGITIIPRVQVSWNDPEDVQVTLIEVQWSPTGQNAWTSNGVTPVGTGLTFFSGPAAGQVIDVQARSIRANGADSVWDQVVGYTVSDTTLSQVTSLYAAPGIPWNVSNNATIDSVVNTEVTGYLRIYGPSGPNTSWTLYTGAGQFSIEPAFLPCDYSSTGYVVIFANSLTGAGIINPAYYQFSDYNDTISDNFIMVGSFTTIAESGSGGTTGGGGSGGNGGGGPRGPACTLEGTMLDTPDGPLNNILVHNRVAFGRSVYLQGADGPERVVSAVWRHVTSHQQLEVGDQTILCSDTHTVRVNGTHQRCANVASGTMIDTRQGPQLMTRTAIKKDAKVLKLTLAGPSHEYSVGGVITHNTQVKSE